MVTPGEAYSRLKNINESNDTMKPNAPRMFHDFLKWLGQRIFRQPEPAPTPPKAVRARPPSKRPAVARPGLVKLNTTINGEIADGGPGKNVLIRNRFVREETGTHDSLKILDASVLESEEEFGIDPYNTGRFDRAKSWETRFRK